MDLTNIKEFLGLVEIAHEVAASCELEWHQKYNLIFSSKISARISELGFAIEWFDPDGSYEDDIFAYLRGLERKRGEIRRVAVYLLKIS